MPFQTANRGTIVVDGGERLTDVHGLGQISGATHCCFVETGSESITEVVQRWRAELELSCSLRAAGEVCATSSAGEAGLSDTRVSGHARPGAQPDGHRGPGADCASRPGRPCPRFEPHAIDGIDLIRDVARFVPYLLTALLAAGAAAASVLVSSWWLIAAVPLVVLAVLGSWDMVQRRHAILRTYPITGHFRWAAEALAPELHQYFVESDWDGRPYDRDVRSIIYARAKDEESESPYGSELLLDEPGREFFAHTIASVAPPEDPPHVKVGGPHCTRPYDLSLLNVSAMSFGALSGNAIRALNGAAAIGGFAHDTGEGGISRYHREPGGDLVWEIGSGYFGCRTEAGDFDPDRFRHLASDDQVKMISIKLSQGAKPGIGGVLPGGKVTGEIAEAREVPKGQTCLSPPAHTAFHTPLELIAFIQQLRELAGGKPIGFKLCLGRRTEFLAICKAMVKTGDGPDFIIVDGSEGGTGAAPLEFEDTVGTPLTEGLLFVHNALVGSGLRQRVTVGASGKVATGADIVRRLSQGADFVNAARAMMMAAGCIQALRCHTNTCPSGVATQDPKRARALDVPDKTQRVANYQRATVASAQRLMGALGVRDPRDLRPALLHRHDALPWSKDYTALYDWLDRDDLVADRASAEWTRLWRLAQAKSFAPAEIPSDAGTLTRHQEGPRA